MIEFLKKTYNKSQKELLNELEDALVNEKRCQIVTANPEIMMNGHLSRRYSRVLLAQDTLITPDGIGVVKAASMAGLPIKERIAGVDMVKDLLIVMNEHKFSLYCFGAKQEVLEKFEEYVNREYSNIQLVGLKDGYNHSEELVIQDIIRRKPDVILVALGVPRQELTIRKYIEKFQKGIFIGVGGALDVLSGTKKRAPEVFIRLNIEWLYRVLSEPARLKRFFQYNVRFFRVLKAEIKKDKMERNGDRYDK